MRRGDEITREVLARPGRYQTVAENLQVKEVMVGEGERRRRYVLCYNPQEAERQRSHRAEVLKELEAELASLREAADEQHSKRECALRASARYGRYLKLTAQGRLLLDAAKVKQAERFDGKFVVHSNDDTLSAEDMALGYKQTAACGGGLADAKERIAPAPGVSLGAASHPCPCGTHRSVAAARARCRACLWGHLAQHSRRSQAHPACAIV